MIKEKALRLVLKAPSAHFRIPQTSNPRQTYMVPPYSTVIGLIANLAGKEALISRLLKVPFALSILCRYEAVSREYTWLRNLEKSKHKDRFGDFNNRTYSGAVEHPGGQSPVTFYLLNNVETVAYLFHPDEELVGMIIDNAGNPERWISHLHLGRSEDWAVLENIKEIDFKVCQHPGELSEGRNYWGWVPKPEKDKSTMQFCGEEDTRRAYKVLYERLSGGCFLVPSVYRKVPVEIVLGSAKNKKNKNEKKIVEIRNFSYIPARAARMSIPLNPDDTVLPILCDPEKSLPIIPALINP